MKIRVIIADDEPLARERIRVLLAREQDVEVVAECANGQETVAAVKAQAADLLFLDVQMPGMDGFEALRAMSTERLPLVIFVTAFDEHAVKAFEVHALDYLLKPFKPQRFKDTVQRARQTLATAQGDAVSEKLLALLGQSRPAQEYITRVIVKTGERVVVLKAEQIEYIEAAGNYVILHVGKENHVLRETLTALEQKLNPRQFLRISRSALVNADQIRELQPLFKGEHAVLLRNGKQLTMTRGIRDVQELLRFA